MKYLLNTYFNSATYHSNAILHVIQLDDDLRLLCHSARFYSINYDTQLSNNLFDI